MSLENLPYRFSFRSVKRFELIISEIVNAYPALSVFETSELTVETFSCRLRDAMKALAQGKWKPTTPNLDMDKFAEVYPLIKVGIRDDKVVAGSKDSVRNCKQLVLDPNTSSLIQPIEVKKPTTEIIVALVVLYHHGILKTPAKIYGDIPEDLLSKFDVIVEKQQDHNLLM